MEKSKVIEEALNEWYSANPARERMLNDIVNGAIGPSLRTIDWFVTNYSARKRISYVSDDGRVVANLNESYKDALRCYHKSRFDVFRRKKDCLVRQRNFFKWAITNGVIEYVTNNIAEINADMAKHKRRPATWRERLLEIPNFANGGKKF